MYGLVLCVFKEKEVLGQLSHYLIFGQAVKQRDFQDGQHSMVIAERQQLRLPVYLKQRQRTDLRDDKSRAILKTISIAN